MARSRDRLNSLAFRAQSRIRACLVGSHRRIENAETKLGQLNPRLVLTRGYAIVLDEAGSIVKNAAAAPAGSDVRILFAEDAVKARVTGSLAK